MATNTPSLYRSQYFAAVALMDEGKFDECIELAKYNLTDPTLSRYFRMKNLLLVADNSEDWYEGERCRRMIASIWDEAHSLTRPDDIQGHEALREVGGTLAELTQELEDQRPEDFDEAMVDEDLEDSEVEDQAEEDEELLEDTEAVNAAEISVWGSEANIAQYMEERRAAGEAARLAWVARKEAEAEAQENLTNNPKAPSSPPNIEVTAPKNPESPVAAQASTAAPPALDDTPTRSGPGRFNTLPIRPLGFMAATRASSARERARSAERSGPSSR